MIRMYGGDRVEFDIRDVVEGELTLGCPVEFELADGTPWKIVVFDEGDPCPCGSGKLFRNCHDPKRWMVGRHGRFRDSGQ